MSASQFGFSNNPLEALLSAPHNARLALIMNLEGPSYRPLGSMMAVFPDGTKIGNLSSGCIEEDIASHLQNMPEDAPPQILRYGKGSPFLDITLPCGGTMDVLLLSKPDISVLQQISQQIEARRACSVLIDISTGDMSVSSAKTTRLEGEMFIWGFEPELRFVIFGNGAEAVAMASLTQSCGYPTHVLSSESSALVQLENLATKNPTKQKQDSSFLISQLYDDGFPKTIEIDAWTSVTTFFHDHSWEPKILAHALNSQAFYVGAQGSRQAQSNRMMELARMGVTEEARKRLHGPIGLIPSAKDPRTLAVSVLAEVLEVARQTPR